METDVFPIYVELWRLCQRLGSRVAYDGRRLQKRGMAGLFDAGERPPKDARPEILIAREAYEKRSEPTRGRNAGASPALPPPDIAYELITLAHEYGHFMSWKERTPRDVWDKRHAARVRLDEVLAEVTAAMPSGLSNDDYGDQHAALVFARMTDAERQLILDEETDAWTFGREPLVVLRFNDLPAYDERTRLGLHNYRCRFGMEGRWPEDAIAINRESA